MTKKSLIKSLIPIAMCVAGTIIGVSISSCTPNTEKITIQLADGVEQASINLEKSNPTSVIQLETVNYNRTELGCVLKIPKGYSEITQFIEINNNSILQITDWTNLENTLFPNGKIHYDESGNKITDSITFNDLQIRYALKQDKHQVSDWIHFSLAV